MGPYSALQVSGCQHRRIRDPRHSAGLLSGCAIEFTAELAWFHLTMVQESFVTLQPGLPSQKEASMNRTRIGIVLLIGSASFVAFCAAGEDYVGMLKERVPAYERHTTGSRAPMWEPMARQVIADYDLSEGIALDIGSSCSPFLIELVERTDMTGYAVDIDPWAMRLLGVMVDEAGLTGEVIPVEGDWQDLPFKDDFADFIFSRGTIPFVPDKVEALRETYRVLKPGGVAYIGHGGFGRLLDPEERERMVERRLQWDTGERERPEGWDGPKEDLTDLAEEADIPNANYRLITEPDVGWWLEIRK